MRDDFGHWFAGFFDGEGSLLVYVGQPDARQHQRARCAASITLRLDDRAILEESQQQLRVGRITDLRNHRMTAAKPCARWAVDDKAGCAAVVAALDRYPLRSKKARDFEVWREAVAVWCALPRGKRWAGAGHSARALTPLRDRLREARAYA